jgi:hypothetical protein
MGSRREHLRAVVFALGLIGADEVLRRLDRNRAIAQTWAYGVDAGEARNPLGKRDSVLRPGLQHESQIWQM